MIFLTFRFLAIAFDTFFSSQTNYLVSVKHLLDFSMAPLPRFVLMQFLLCRNCFWKLSLPYLISFINISMKTRFYNIMFIV